MAHYSEKCSHLLTSFWDRRKQACVSCEETFAKLPGKECTANCGLPDEGGRRDVPYRDCDRGSFNDGSFTTCRPCSVCPRGGRTLAQCSATADTRCCKGRDCGPDRGLTTTVKSLTVGASTLIPTVLAPSSSTLNTDSQAGHSGGYLVAIGLLLVLALCVLLIYIYRKWKRTRTSLGDLEGQPHGQFSLNDCLPVQSKQILYTNGQSCSSKRTAAANEEYTLLQTEPKDPEHHLSAELQSWPLQKLLDNLDMVDELGVLLDPETPGVKNTCHLASRCSFPSTWVTYAYSLRPSRSPFRMLLEALTTRHPDWTVGHLARLLQEMDRNDTVAVLAKLTLTNDII